MLQSILPLYNAKYADTLQEEFIYQYDLSPIISASCKNLFSEFADHNLIMGAEVADGAIDVLTYLSKYHDIYFVTAGHPYTAAARDDFLSMHFPFYRSSHLIVCREKQLLNVDVLIDDYENNLIGGTYEKILMTKPWNEHVATNLYGIKRIFGWDEVPKIIENYERRERNTLWT
mgnify:CR=1 FL=1